MTAITNICHSTISDYPPNLLKYPKFYNTKERIVVLDPGDMLYIPPRWGHWIDSYPDSNSGNKTEENLAISFPIVDFKGEVYNDFGNEVPFTYHLSRDKYKFLNWDMKYILSKNNPESIHNVLMSGGPRLYPVIKPECDVKCTFQPASVLDIKQLLISKHYISIGQNWSLLKPLKSEVTPPDFWLESFPNSVSQASLWLSSSGLNSEPVNTGLHYDYNHNILIQIKGKKLVRLYPPNDIPNLYIQPMKMLTISKLA